MTASRMNALAWIAEIAGLVVVLLGVIGTIPERFLLAGLILMVLGILAKRRANRMARRD